MLTAKIERSYATAAAAAPAYEPAPAPEIAFVATSGSLAYAPEVVEFEELRDPEPSGALSGRFCASCSEELEAGAHFCSQCGVSVEDAPTWEVYEPAGFEQEQASSQDDSPPTLSRVASRTSSRTPSRTSSETSSEALPQPSTHVLPIPADADDLKPGRNTLHLVSPTPDTLAADPAELLPALDSRRLLRRTLAEMDGVTIALVCACAGLIAAAGVHLISPRSIPGFSAAEVDLKIQMRAVQWLLAGILAALVGLLARRGEPKG